jgi:addiction module RelE/StbE family toxin
MKNIVTSRRFEKKLISFCKNNKNLQNKVIKVIDLLSKDCFDKKLSTHKLSGKLAECYACSIDHSNRLVFSFDLQDIYLLNIGSHDDVY